MSGVPSTGPRHWRSGTLSFTIRIYLFKYLGTLFHLTKRLLCRVDLWTKLYWSASRGTRCVCKKSPKRQPNPYSSKLIHNFYLGKKLNKNLGYFRKLKNCTNKTLVQKSKFSKSGHPVCQPE
jgi:hypothetical protein